MSEAAPQETRITVREVLTLTALGALYLVQGMPFGYQVDVLPVVLREQGASYTVISIAKALALPWALKVFAAPFMDAYGSPRFGRRKTFILPLQIGLATSMFAASVLPVTESLYTLCALLFAMNFFAATMDVAVDGLALDTLRARALGYGNAVQVVGFRLGMILAGGVLASRVGDIGLEGMFLVMGGVTVLVHLVTWLFPENKLDLVEVREAPRMGSAVTRTFRAIIAKEGRAIVLFILFYKAGESIADSMWRPMLVDSGYGLEEIALYVNTFGAGAAVLGPFFAGALIRFLGVHRALLFLLGLRVIPVAGELSVALGSRAHDFVLGVTMLEHFAGSAVTTATFALMMTVVDPRVGATQFTTLATIEVIGKMLVGWLSGLVADGLGTVRAYAIAVALTLAFAVVGPVLSRRALDTRAAA
jgi:PAT family beta-lactamase induction signal transducer AmpG